MSWFNRIFSSSRERQAAPEHQASVDADQAEKEFRSQLAALKKIRITGLEAQSHAEVVANIEKGDPQANWIIGECYLRGIVLMMEPFPKDKVRGEYWQRRSAGMGLTSSQCGLGMKYLGERLWDLGMAYDPNGALDQNLDEAVKWLTLAAEGDGILDWQAQALLGEMYFQGIGVRQDHAKAYDLFTKSEANPNNAMSRFGLPRRALERLSVLQSELFG